MAKNNNASGAAALAGVAMVIAATVAAAKGLVPDVAILLAASAGVGLVAASRIPRKSWARGGISALVVSAVAAVLVYGSIHSDYMAPTRPMVGGVAETTGIVLEKVGVFIRHLSGGGKR